MYWCNKSKQERRKNWITVQAPDRSLTREAHAWCRQQPSRGRFYHHYTNTRWWFESELDAIMFALRWS
jgi:hypothetical protein